jgi:hypothetical protein
VSASKLNYMTAKETTILINKHLVNYLAEYGYNCLGVKFGGYQIQKKNANLNHICIGRLLTRSNGIELTSPSDFLKLNLVNQLLDELCEKHELAISDTTINNFDNSESTVKIRREMANILIHDETSFLVWVEKFKEYWEKIVIPFQTKYQTIEALNDKINEEGNEIISWFGDYWMHKKLIIMKWTGNSQYSEFEKFFIEFHNDAKKEVEGGKYRNYIDAAQEFCQKLRTTHKPMDSN